MIRVCFMSSNGEVKTVVCHGVWATHNNPVCNGPALMLAPGAPGNYNLAIPMAYEKAAWLVEEACKNGYLNVSTMQEA